MTGKMMKAPKAALKPYVDAYMQMVHAVHALDDKGLAELRRTVGKFGQTNCWFREFEAAKIVGALISDEARSRALPPTKQGEPG